MYSQKPTIYLKLAIWLCFFSHLHQLSLARKTKSRGVRRRLTQSEGCILSKVHTELDDGNTLHSWECELQPGDADQAGVLFVNLDGLNDTDLDAAAVSGETTLYAEGAVIADGRLSIPKGSKKTLGKIDKRGPADKAKKSKKGTKKGRKLIPTAPVPRKVLVVRVDALDANTTADVPTLAGDIFGIGRDSNYVCLSERLRSCSYGQTQVTPYNGVTRNNVTIQNGVIEMVLDMAVTGSPASKIHNEVLKRLRLWLGIPNLSSVFDHVMLCLPPGTMGTWIAYAYVNNWFSVYNNDWCRYPSSQVHEIGHNLGLNHAGEGPLVYGDRTGYMGYSYPAFNQKMCYSPVKSWQLGWYAQKQETLDFNSRGGFTGSLIGIDDYLNSKAVGKYVQLRVPGPYEDLYIGFNRNTGINTDTKEAANQVTVQAQTGTGVSDLRARLSTGNQYVVPQFLNGMDLIIMVNNIKRPGNPAYADVSVYLNGCPPGQCGIQCHVPCPTPAPTSAIILPDPAVPVPPYDPSAIPPTPSPTISALLVPYIGTSGAGSSTPAPQATPAPVATSAPVAPPPPSTLVFSESFDSGASSVFQVTNGEISNKIVNTASGSTMSLRLKSYGSQLDTLSSYPVANFQQVNISFWFYPTKGVAGDKILVDLSTDDGVSWMNIAMIRRNREFRTNKIWYQKVVSWPVAAGVQSIRVRIYTQASSYRNSRGKIFVDDISMSGF